MVHVLAETPICMGMAFSALYFWENCNRRCTLILTALILLKDMKEERGLHRDSVMEVSIGPPGLYSQSNCN